MKKFLLTFVFIFLILALSACGVPKNEPDIVSDVSNCYSSIFQGINLTSYEITQRTTEETKDIIEVTVTDTLNKYDVSLAYDYIEDKGWVLNPKECKIVIPENTPDLFKDVSALTMPLRKKSTVASVNQISNEQSVGTNNITVEVLCEADDATCTIQLKCLYKFHAKKGWHLDSFSPTNTEHWNATPTKGISQDTIDSLEENLYKNGCGSETTFNYVALSDMDADYSDCVQEIPFDVRNDSGIKGISGKVTYTFLFNSYFENNTLVWGWEQNSTTPHYTRNESYEKWEGKWYIDASASKQSGEYIIAISGNNVKVLSPNGYTSYGVIDGTGAYISMRYSNVFDDTNTRITFRDDNTIDYSYDGFMGRRVIERMYRTPSYAVTRADERFRNNFGY